MATVSQSGVYNLQAFTSLGALGVGYRLYTYTAGTTTHKTAYTDSAGAVAHTYTNDGSGGQYIAMDARGELPAPLYLTSGAYDLALKTAAGATVWTRQADPIGDPTSVITTLLALTPGATVDVDAGAATAFTLTPDQNFTLNAPTNPSNGMVRNLVFTQGATPYTITWDAAYQFPGGTEAVLTASANAVDFMSMYYNAATSKWICVMNKDFKA